MVDDRVSLLRPDGKQTALIDADQVKERYGVCPDQIVDYLSMIGDSVDDIPGIPGVGPKTAAALLQQFGTFDATLDRVAEVSRPKLRAAIVEHADRVQRNRQLVALRKTLDLAVGWRELTPSEPNQAQLRELYRTLGFKSLLAELDPPVAQTGDLFSGNT